MQRLIDKCHVFIFFLAIMVANGIKDKCKNMMKNRACTSLKMFLPMYWFILDSFIANNSYIPASMFAVSKYDTCYA